MKLLDKVFYKIKPIFYVFFFEITFQFKKFIIFSSITILQLFLNCYLIILTGSSLTGSLDWFYYYGTTYFSTIIMITVCFFFSGIISSEYKNKTGLILIPLTSKNKFLIGKYLANLILVIGIVVIHYSLLILLGYNFYGEPIINTWIFSFSFALLYIIALSSLVIFFSSVMPSQISTFIIVFGLAIIGFDFINVFIEIMFSGFKPIYSLTYLSQIITNITILDFDFTQDYVSVEAILTVFLFYIIFFFIMALILFKRREF